MDLIIKFRSGDNFSFFEIYKHFEKLINVYAKQCEDTKQELILFLIELLKTVDLSKFKMDDSNSLQRYIAVSIKNKYINLLKKEQYHIVNTYNGEFAEIYFIHFDDHIQDRLFIQTSLKNISKKQKEVLVYKYIYGLSTAEICKKLKISRQALNQLQNRGIAKIKRNGW